MRLWSLVFFWYWIETGGGGSGDQLLQHLHRREQDTAGIQEWGRERDRGKVKVREMPVIKPSPVSLGRLGGLQDRALGQKQEANEPMTVSIILLSGVSVSWDAGCWSYSPCRITVPAVSWEHAYDNKADMWTKGWGCGLPTPLCTRQLDCSPSWKGKQMDFSAECNETMTKMYLSLELRGEKSF